MEGRTKVIWDFLDTAYKTGALDEFLNLSKNLADRKYENQALVFEELEDAICEMEDFSSVDETLEKAYVLMPGLANEEVLEGLGILVSWVAPLAGSLTASVDRDMTKLLDKQDKIKEDLPKVIKALVALIALNRESILEALSSRPAKEYGERAGKALNYMANFVNELHSKNPDTVSDFLSGAFNAVDKQEVGKMADTLTQGFLDQKPGVFKWTAATMAKRAKKLVFNK